MASTFIDNGNRTFSVSKTLVHKMLNCADISSNRNKFYEASLEVSPNGEYRVATRYGRVGEEGKPDNRYFQGRITEDAAKSEYLKLIQSKIKKGYQEIEVEKATISDSVDISALSALDKLIMQLYDEAISAVKKHIQTPLGKLTKEQVNKAKDILNMLYDALSAKAKRDELERLSNLLYTNLPQKTATRYVKLPVIQDFETLQRQIELIDVVSSLYNVQNAIDGDAKARYEATGADIELLPETDREWARIQDYVNSTESRHHNARLHVKNIFKVNIKGEDEKFNPKNLKTMELFHGTRSANLLNILTQGLMIKPKTAVHTGSMFGNGIYFADQSTKSSQYAHRWAENKHPTSFLFLCDVAVGDMKEYRDGHSYLNRAPQGFDSVKGVAGPHLLHNEYIVYRLDQSKIKYLIEFAVSSKRR